MARPAHGRSNALRQVRRRLRIKVAVLDRRPERLKTRVRLRALRALQEMVFNLQALHQIELAIDVAMDKRLNLSAIQVTTPSPRCHPTFDEAARGHAPGGT